MRVLITGGAGFIGSHLAAALLERGARVRVLDDLSTGRMENLEGLDVELRRGSILEPAALTGAVEGAEWVFHLAAMISVPESMERPIACEALNASGTLEVLQAAARAGARRLCFSSSAAIYGDEPTLPKREEMAPHPRSPYAITKLAGEQYCQLFQREGWLSAVSLRYFNVFGPRQDPNSPYAAAVPIFAARARAGAPITIFGDGGQTRDFIYVRDVVDANLFLAERPELGGAFNVARGGRTSILELAERIRRALGSGSEIRFGPERAGDIRHSTASVERMASAGWRAGWSLEAGLAEMLSGPEGRPR